MPKSRTNQNTELTFYDDLIEYPEERGILKKFGVDGSKSYRTKIEKCTQCNSREISKLEVLGAYNGTLFWNCDDCLTLHLRFSSSYTEQLLRRAKNFWTNPNDWTEEGRMNNEA